MSETKYTVKVQVPHELSTEQKAEILAEIRNALRGLPNIHFGMKVVVTGEVTNEELMESLRGEPIPTINYPQTNSQSREQCMHYDAAQGRHRCCCLIRKSNKCEGVCKDYEPKKI